MAIEKKDPKPTTDTPAEDKILMVSEKELKALVEDAALSILEARLKTQGPAFDMAKLGEIIGQAVADGMKKNTRPKVGIAEYLRRGYSAFHPTPITAETPRPHLLRETYVNGAPLSENTTYDAEVELVNRITHGGRYINRLVDVHLESAGSDDIVHINFSNTVAGISAIRDHVNSVGCKSVFHAMLRDIVKEQEAQDKEQALAEEMKREQRREYLAKKLAHEQVVEA